MALPCCSPGDLADLVEPARAKTKPCPVPAAHALDCYFDPVLTCRHDAPKASAYVAVFDAPCPNPLMPSPAVCAASAASFCSCHALSPARKCCATARAR